MYSNVNASITIVIVYIVPYHEKPDVLESRSGSFEFQGQISTTRAWALTSDKLVVA